MTNVYGQEYEIEIIGTDTFDEENEDWACEETWEPNQRSLEVPSGELGTHWEEVLENAKMLVAEYLNTGSKAGMLKSTEGIGIGFVDGNMELLWKRN